jgi:hypothetical protein
MDTAGGVAPALSRDLLVNFPQECRPEILELPAYPRLTHFVGEHAFEYHAHELREQAHRIPQTIGKLLAADNTIQRF